MGVVVASVVVVVVVASVGVGVVVVAVAVAVAAVVLWLPPPEQWRQQARQVLAERKASKGCQVHKQACFRTLI